MRHLGIVATLSLLFAGVLPGGGVWGQGGVLLGTEMVVSVPPVPGRVEVRIRYLAILQNQGQDFPLTLLTPGSAGVFGLRVGSESGRASLDGGLTLQEIRPGYWTGSVPVPPSSTPGDTIVVDLAYTVEGGWEEGGRVTIPIPAPGWAPRDPHPRSFLADVEVPPGLTVTESFPTSVFQRPSGARGGQYRIGLQSVPSLLILRVVTGEAPLVTLERTLDLLVVLTLLVMGLMGIRFLRGGGR